MATYFKVLLHLHGIVGTAGVMLWILYGADVFLGLAFANLLMGLQCKLCKDYFSKK